jgi:kinesin family protein C2/C3
MEEALLQSKEETQTLKEEVVRLESALVSSREDCEKLQSAFDEISHRERLDTSDQNQALAMKTKEIGDLHVQVCELKEELANVMDNNMLITKTLKDAEDKVLSLQTIIDEQRPVVLNASPAPSSNELVDARDAIASLESLLEAKRNEVDEQKMEDAAVRASLQEKLLNAHTDLAIAQEELTLTRSKLMTLESARSSRILEDQCLANNESMSDLDVRKQLNTNSGHIQFAEKDVKEPASDLISMEDSTIDDILQSNDPKMIAKEVRALAKKMSAQKSFNAELLTRILKLQGNIQVCCRIRPMTANEKQQGLHEVVQPLSETEVGCFDERTKSWKSYAFDKVWGAESKQMDVFQDVEPLALSVIDGYNACIFAYGQSKFA